MNSSRKLLATAILAAAAAIPAVASAQQKGAQTRAAETGWYAGVDVGRGEIDNGPDDTALRVLGGYRINPMFAVEAAYSELINQNNVEANALELVGVGSYPLGNQFSLFGKVGIANVEVKGGGVKDDGAELTLGFGLQYDLAPRFAIRGQWQRYNTDDAIDAITIGFIYKF